MKLFIIFSVWKYPLLLYDRIFMIVFIRVDKSYQLPQHTYYNLWGMRLMDEYVMRFRSLMIWLFLPNAAPLCYFLFTIYPVFLLLYFCCLFLFVYDFDLLKMMAIPNAKVFRRWTTPLFGFRLRGAFVVRSSKDWSHLSFAMICGLSLNLDSVHYFHKSFRFCIRFLTQTQTTEVTKKTSFTSRFGASYLLPLS